MPCTSASHDSHASLARRLCIPLTDYEFCHCFGLFDMVKSLEIQTKSRIIHIDDRESEVISQAVNDDICGEPKIIAKLRQKERWT